MEQQNIDNLTSLWLLASKPFDAYKKIGSFNVVEINFSEWPNKIWQDNRDKNLSAENAKNILQHNPTKLVFSKWNPLQSDEHKEAKNLGLILKSIQIGMSLNLQDYNVQSLNSSVFLEKVHNKGKAVLWSEVFHKCFGYSISFNIIEAMKEDVAFYLINNNMNTVGCVATFTKDNQTGIHSLGILDEFRKQGFAEIVMHFLLQESKNNGIANAHLQSSMLGLNIYRRIGFQELFKMCNYRI
jgi:ribosomal protein S18 acetylase RimI-like enzyme